MRDYTSRNRCSRFNIRPKEPELRREILRIDDRQDGGEKRGMVMVRKKRQQQRGGVLVLDSVFFTSARCLC